MLRTQLRSAVVLVPLLFLSGGLSAQVSTGTPKYGSFGGGPFDVLNFGNNNVHFAIPVIHKAGRGLEFTYDLSYDSSLWTPTGSNGNQSWTPATNWGWRGQTEIATGFLTYTTKAMKCFDPDAGGGRGGWVPYTMYMWTGYHDSFGSNHKFGYLVATNDGACGQDPTSVTKMAIDGSGYTLYATGGSANVSTAAGTLINPPLNQTGGSGSFTDPNGNQLTANGNGQFFDTLSGTTPVLTVAGGNPLTFTYLSPTGGNAVYKMVYTNKTVRTYFRCTTVTDFPATATVPLVTEIDLPDYNPTTNPNSRYTFTYESSGDPNSPGSVTGRIASVTLPTGGEIDYAYSGGTNGINCNDGSAATLTRTLKDGGQTLGTWTYARSGTGTAWTTMITDPNSNLTQIDFQQDSSTNATNDFFEVRRLEYQGSSNLLRTTITCYNGQSVTTPANCPTTPVATQINRKTVFTYLPDASGLQSETDTTYAPHGGRTEVDVYDFGSQAVGPVLRKAIISYLGLGLGYRRSTVTIEDANNNVAARTTYIYDQTGLSTPSGTTPQHVNGTNSGNVTEVKVMANSTTTLYRKLTYYNTGMLATSTDFSTSETNDGPTTTYTYNNSGSPSPSCGNSFTTSITTTQPVTLTRSMTWNCTGGVMTGETDENGNPTTFAYTDPLFWRPSSVSYGDGGKDSFTYSPILPWSILLSSTFDGTQNNSMVSKDILDGFGRTKQTQLTSDPSGTVFTDTTYDGFGQVASVSNPYRSQSDPTYGLTAFTYDALGRVITLTRPDNSTVLMDYSGRATRTQDEGNGAKRVTRIFQSDALGQLTSVCEVTSTVLLGITPNPTSCGQDIAATGFLTSYQYDMLGNLKNVTQGGLNTRSYAYDMMSRLTSEINPEVPVGTGDYSATYTYDTYRAGDLYQRVSPKPNQTNTTNKITTTYQYDALHRLTSVTYNDGVTPSITRSYDQTSVSGNNLTNSKGRLTNAVVGSNTAGTIFSYDPVGRIADEWQCTPLNCGTGNFHLHFGYDRIGDLTGVTNYAENYAYTYSYDTAARLVSLASSYNNPPDHPPTLLTVNQYNPLGLIQRATLGNSVVRNVQYDNRGRLTSLGDGSVYGFGLSYTPDGNIASVGNDSINGNWTYSYDDFSRLATANKNNGQLAFSYQYDRYGNRWQQNVTAGIGPSPSYSFDANNHISGSGVVYDAAGNITNDGLGNTYTYDGEHRLVTVGGANAATYVYDSMGRRVRTTANGVVKDFVFDQSSRAVTQMSPGWTRSELYAGGLHIGTYANNSTYFEHTDWLGTVHARSDVTGARIETCTSLPFGDGMNCNGSDWSPLHFTTQELDSETGLTHFLYRQLSTTEGRWAVPDPVGLSAVDPSDPQSWNRYSYVDNMPCSVVDLLGLAKCNLSVGITFSAAITAGLQKTIENSLQNLFGPDVSLQFNVGGAGQVNIAIGIVGGVEPGAGGYASGNWGIVDFGQALSAQFALSGPQGQTSRLGKAIGRLAAHEIGHELGIDHGFGVMAPAIKPFVPQQFTKGDLLGILAQCLNLKNGARPGGGGGGGAGGGVGLLGGGDGTNPVLGTGGGGGQWIEACVEVAGDKSCTWYYVE